MHPPLVACLILVLASRQVHFLMAGTPGLCMSARNTVMLRLVLGHEQLTFDLNNVH